MAENWRKDPKLVAWAKRVSGPVQRGQDRSPFRSWRQWLEGPEGVMLGRTHQYSWREERSCFVASKAELEELLKRAAAWVIQERRARGAPEARVWWKLPIRGQSLPPYGWEILHPYNEEISQLETLLRETSAKFLITYRSVRIRVPSLELKWIAVPHIPDRWLVALAASPRVPYRNLAGGRLVANISRPREVTRAAVWMEMFRSRAERLREKLAQRYRKQLERLGTFGEDDRHRIVSPLILGRSSEGVLVVDVTEYLSVHRFRGLVQVVVRDVSTGQLHSLSVPSRFGSRKYRGTMAQRIHAALAWTFHLRPKDYHPDVET